MIYFDKDMSKVLLYIHRRKYQGVIEHKLHSKFGEDVPNKLIALVQEDYIRCYDTNNNAISFDHSPYTTEWNFIYYSTPKGNELIETRIFNFWKWIIPTFISILALIVTIFAP